MRRASTPAEVDRLCGHAARAGAGASAAPPPATAGRARRCRTDFYAPLDQRRAGADPLGRTRSGDTTRSGRASRRIAAQRRHVVAAGYGHIVSPHACAPRLIEKFVDEAGFATLPQSCLDYLATASGRRCSRRCWSRSDRRRRAREELRQAHAKSAVDGATFRADDGRDHRPAGTQRRRQDHAAANARDADPPDAGTATIDGLDVVRDRYAVRERIGVLSDARGLYARLTARENVRYYGRLHGLRGAALDARIDALLAQFGLTELADRRTHGFSQGERMKVAIARALVHDPATILLDEPTNGLDVMSIRGLRELLRGLRQPASASCYRPT